MKIGFIGLGNMGASLARLVSKKGSDNQLLLANRSMEKAEILSQEIGGTVETNQVVMEQADLIFLGVKPAQFEELLQKYKEVLKERKSVLFISMAAGLELKTLQGMTAPQHRFIRMMPNTPLAVGQGVISYCLSSNIEPTDQSFFRELLSHAGTLIEMDEKQMDAATALAGCGPAFVYQFIEALSDAGVKNGLARDVAIQMAAQTVLGAAQMVKDSGKHPAMLKDKVCSPGGSTIAGVASLENSAFRGSVIKAVDAAYRRTQDLGK